MTPITTPAYIRPDSPPTGFYDPSIDAQVRASGRGLGDLFEDDATRRLRGANDYTTARGDITRQRDESLADLLTNYQRGLSDSQLGEGRMREDYGTSLATLDRNYQRLGGQQGQQATMAGLGGSAAAQAASKRATNRAIDQAPIDTNFNRGIADLLTNRSRMTDDYGLNVRRTNEGADRSYGQLDTDWRRQQEDWTTEVTRAQRENLEFGQDANAQRWFQARQGGYVEPAAPAAPKPKPIVVAPRRRSRGRR